MRVTVTKQDIRAGEAHNACFCPIARAINRMFPNSEAYVYSAHVWTGDYKWIPSGSAQRFIDDFDNRRPVKPATFIFRKAK